MKPPEPPFRAFVMDRPLLYPLVERLRADERLPAFAAGAAGAAHASRSRGCRCSWRRCTRSSGAALCVLLPEDADARDAAEAAGWFVGEDHVALLPSRGVQLGLRARAAAASRRRAGPRARRCSPRGGLVCSSALALAEAMPPPAARPAPIARRPGRRARDRRARRGARARRLRAGRAGRGARPVRRSRRARRRLPDDRPRAVPDRALRRRDRGDPRLLAVHPAGAARGRRGRPSTPPRERRARPRRARRCRDDDEPPSRSPTTSSCRSTASPDLVWQPDEVRARLERGGTRRGSTLDGAAELDTLPQGQPFSFDVQRPALVARGLSEAENELAGLAAAGPRRRRRLRRTAARPSAGGTSCAGSRRRCSSPGEERRAGCRSRSRPARRGFVWRELGVALLPDTQVFRRRPPRATARRRPRARELLRPAHRRLRRPRGPRDRAAARLRDEGGRRASPATTSCSASAATTGVYVPHEQIGKVSRYIGADSQRADALEARRQGLGQPEDPRPRSTCASWRESCSSSTRERQTQAGRRLRRRARVGRAARGRVPLPRDRGPGAARSRRSRRTSRRRVRWTGSSAATSASARPRSRCAAAFTVAVAGKQVLMLVPTTILAQQHWNTFRERYRDFPVRVEMVSRFRKPAEVEAGARRLRRGQGRRPDRHAPRSSRAT